MRRMVRSMAVSHPARYNGASVAGLPEAASLKRELLCFQMRLPFLGEDAVCALTAENRLAHYRLPGGLSSFSHQFLHFVQRIFANFRCFLDGLSVLSCTSDARKDCASAAPWRPRAPVGRLEDDVKIVRIAGAKRPFRHFKAQLQFATANQSPGNRFRLFWCQNAKFCKLLRPLDCAMKCYLIAIFKISCHSTHHGPILDFSVDPRK